MGRQSGAVGVDEGLDFLCFLIAGLNLQEKDPFTRKPQKKSSQANSKHMSKVE